MTTRYRQRTMTASVADRGWRDIDLDALSPFAREQTLGDKDHYVEVARNGGWYAASVWAMPASERGARNEVKRLQGQADAIRGRAERPIEAAQNRLEGAKAAVDAARREVEVAEDGLKAAKSAQHAAEEEAKAVDKQVASAEAELTAILARQSGAGAVPA